MVNGFDTDFVLLLAPCDPKIATQMKKIVDRVDERLNTGGNFCFKINFSDLQSRQADMSEFKNLVYWQNCEFYITNHCRPNRPLLLNLGVIWCPASSYADGFASLSHHKESFLLR